MASLDGTGAGVRAGVERVCVSQTIEQLVGSAASDCLCGRRVSCRLELHKAGGRTSAKLRLGLQAGKTRIKQHEGHSLL